MNFLFSILFLLPFQTAQPTELGYPTLINLAGKQRMYTQRIAKCAALQQVYSNRKLDSELERSITLFEEGQRVKIGRAHV